MAVARTARLTYCILLFVAVFLLLCILPNIGVSQLLNTFPAFVKSGASGVRGFNVDARQRRHIKAFTDLVETYTNIYANMTVDNPLPDLDNLDFYNFQWWQAAAVIDWYSRGRGPNRYNCSNQVTYGNWRVCQDKKFQVRPPCLVYSVGIAGDFRFDDAMAERGCEVHSFDPSMGKSDHRRSERVFFHNMGLHGYSTDKFVPRFDAYVKEKQYWKIRTLEDIREMLGHTERPIDVLKVDIEGTEWAALDNMIETGQLTTVRQFLFEFHLFPNFPRKDSYIHLLKMYNKVREKLGFKEFLVQQHDRIVERSKFNLQGDVGIVNTLYGKTHQ